MAVCSLSGQAANNYGKLVREDEQTRRATVSFLLSIGKQQFSIILHINNSSVAAATGRFSSCHDQIQTTGYGQFITNSM